MLEKELLQTLIMWSAIDKQDQERLAAIRQELAILGSREETKHEMLRVTLYQRCIPASLANQRGTCQATKSASTMHQKAQAHIKVSEAALKFRKCLDAQQPTHPHNIISSNKTRPPHNPYSQKSHPPQSFLPYRSPHHPHIHFPINISLRGKQSPFSFNVNKKKIIYKAPTEE